MIVVPTCNARGTLGPLMGAFTPRRFAWLDLAASVDALRMLQRLDRRRGASGTACPTSRLKPFSTSCGNSGRSQGLRRAGMMGAMRHQSGRHFLQIPGPTNVPERVLRAMARPTIDHRGPEFARLGLEILRGLQEIFQTSGPVVIYPSSGTGAWEAALVNTLSPGDKVLMFETGHFAALWREMAVRLGLEVEFVAGDWRHGVDSSLVEEKLAADGRHEIQAVAVVHNETSTGVASRIGEIRRATDRAGHPSLLLVDTISSL